MDHGIDINGIPCFNRINSCRSIPTAVSEFIANCLKTQFQSYQFMQINPDIAAADAKAQADKASFNRINSCRSIPTRPRKSKYI